MSNYNYTVIGKDGKQKKGTLEADTRDLAIGELKVEGNTIIALEEANALNANISLDIGGKPTSRDMSVFCRQFVSIVEAGVPVISALQMLSEQTQNKRLREAIVGCKKSIEKGSTLADAMRQYPQIFSKIFVTMVEAGEQSGSLAKSFSRMGMQYEKEHTLKAMVKKTSIYPTVLIIVTIIVVIIMLSFVVPTFRDMLESLDTPLPRVTIFVLNLSNVIKKYWYIIATVVVLIVAGYQTAKRTPGGKEFLDKTQLKMPKLGDLKTKENAAAFTRTLATLLATGIPMMEALSITAGTLTNVMFEKAVMAARDAVSMGSNLSMPLKDSAVFPPLVYHMIGIGESTGDIDGMLDKVADYYDEEVKEATEQLMALLEPLIIIALAVIVGTIIMSVILPMASMYKSLDRA
ncbi:MAG: type II secretion system F family protein [Lachnospiraceae bacterium]|nr:type II secretion system F family protein [Lachnospiraceae bacterium]